MKKNVQILLVIFTAAFVSLSAYILSSLQVLTEDVVISSFDYHPMSGPLENLTESHYVIHLQDGRTIKRPPGWVRDLGIQPGDTIEILLSEK